MQGLHDRLKENLQDILKRAQEEVHGKSDQILIFGHTHHPFINQAENLVNTGSWVNDADPRNTYVELEDGRPRLFVFGGKEIKERRDIT